jgi:hypothetical protein
VIPVLRRPVQRADVDGLLSIQVHAGRDHAMSADELEAYGERLLSLSR